MGYLPKKYGGGGKKRVKPSVSGDTDNDRSLWRLYSVLFKHRSIMPDTVSKQDPEDLFRMLEGLDESDVSEPLKPEQMDEHMKMFYGL